MKKERIKVNYKPLWKKMIDEDISKSELRTKTGIAPSTFTKMSNNEYVALDVLVRICDVMNCGLDEIIDIEKSWFLKYLEYEILFPTKRTFWYGWKKHFII